MLNENIGLIDSGVGGLSVLKELLKIMPDESYVYFGDNKNAPYGDKTDDELFRLAVKDIDFCSDFGLKALVCACNTLSLKLADKIRYYTKIPTFFVYPPQEVCSVKYKKTLLIATTASIASLPKISGITYFAPEGLVSAIENLAAYNINVDLNIYLPFKEKEFECVILGCTHFSLLKNEIFDHLKPLECYCGETFTAKQVEKNIKKKKSLGICRRNPVLFVGENAEINKNFWNKVVNTPQKNNKNT